MLTIYRRHLKRCEHRSEGRKYRRCKCPLWVDGFLRGTEIRKALQLRDWEKAQELVRLWESGGSEEMIQDPTPQNSVNPISEAQNEPSNPSINDVCDRFIADATARGLLEPTLYKYRLLFRRLQQFAASVGLRHLREFDLDSLQRFRATWSKRNLASRKKLEALRTFFRFACECGWVKANLAAKLKAPKIDDKPTLPLAREEVRAILAACDEYPNKLNAVRLRALVLLLRYSGLRIRDAVTLSRKRVQNDKLFLYTAKTGTAVYCPLPSFVVQALAAIPASEYFFWTGNSKHKSAVGDWQRALKRLFVLAGVPDAHAHRFRDTFSVELLQAGVPIERVSVLLGHRSVRITEKHYNAWTLARQEQAEADVRRTWNEPPSATKGTPQVRGENIFIN